VLDGVRVVEMAGLGPVPFAAMVLSDMGAEVIRIDRASAADATSDTASSLLRGRRSIALNLKQPAAVNLVRRLTRTADVLLEGFRPGVMERLGLGPAQLMAERPQLVYGRMTGWGQDGPIAHHAGHDINYIAVAGVLDHIGPAEFPFPPINLVGDFGGGAMSLLVGVLGALFHAQRTGTGQVIDAAMIDGSALLMTPVHDRYRRGQWVLDRAANVFDGGAPYYTTYRCADRRHIAVGAVEPQFYRRLVTALGLREEDLPDRDDTKNWPALRVIFAERFATRRRHEWADLFADPDACVTPVLSLEEAATHPQNVARRIFSEAGGLPNQPQPAPRFSETPSRTGAPSDPAGATVDVLTELGYSPEQQAALGGVAFQASRR
jgi:alpha-methylacyl-CoA racemase